MLPSGTGLIILHGIDIADLRSFAVSMLASSVICAANVVAATTDSNSRSISTPDAAVTVLADITDVGSRKTFVLDAATDVVAVITDSISRSMWMGTTLVFTDVSIADTASRKMFILDTASVDAVIVDTSSRVAEPDAIVIVAPHVPLVTPSVASYNSNSYSFPFVAPEQSSPNCNSVS